jgi:5-dehydro-2-deoxygluconokinase
MASLHLYHTPSQTLIYDRKVTSHPDLEMLTIGRVSVDLYAEQVNANATNVQSFRKSIGGTTTNVAVAAARLGRRAGVCTRVGNDEFGEYIISALTNTFGVDVRFVSRDDEFKTPLAFVMLDPPEEPRVVFYREPRAPDMNITMADLDAATVNVVPILWIAASNLAYEPCRSTMHEVLTARHCEPEAGRTTATVRHTVLDLDWRPMFWRSPAEATAEIVSVLTKFSVVIGNCAECEIAVGTADPEVAIERLLSLGLDAAVVKLGADGVLVGDRHGLREHVAPINIEVMSGVGAGDAFGAALCHGLLSGWDLATCARFGNAAGAIVASRLTCADDMPTLAEVTALAHATSSPT